MQLKGIELFHGDCIDLMNNIPDNSVDLILCDLPYGTLARGYRDSKAHWDIPIDFDKLKEQYNRIIKDDGIICLFGIEPFTSFIIVNFIDLYRYSWIWKKDGASGYLNVNYAPLKITEDIVILSKSSVGSNSDNPIKYFPQGVVEVNVQKHNSPNSTWRVNHGFSQSNNKLNSSEPYIQKYTNYPKNLLEFDRDKCEFHPTQKPVMLLEYLIKTYTKESDIVLDNCMGSGSTGVACINTNRRFIGIELDEKYFNVACKRLETIQKNKPIKLF